MVRTVRGLGLATVALSAILVPTGASASGGYTLGCNGTSPVPVIPNSFVTCTRGEIKSDDDGAYAFTYNPPLTCGGSGNFTVSAAGPEGQLAPGSGSYTTAGPFVTVTFSYLVLENSVPPAVERHNFALRIDCLTGATTGTLSE